LLIVSLLVKKNILKNKKYNAILHKVKIYLLFIIVGGESRVIFSYWGKTDKDNGSYHLLPYHSLDATATATLLLEKQKRWRSFFEQISGIDSKTISAWLAYLIALHDIGKFSEAFQNLNPELFKLLQGKVGKKVYGKNGMRHDSIGFLLWRDYLSENMIQTLSTLGNFENDDESYWQECLKRLMQSVTGHHGKPPYFGDDPLKTFCSKQDEEASLIYTKEVAKIILPQKKVSLACSIKEWSKVAEFLSWHLSGLTVVADWIASNSDFFTHIKEPMPLEKYWREIALPSAEKAITKVEILPQNPALPSTFKKLFTKIKAPSPLQELSESLTITKTPQLFIIEEATGSGKTETAIMLAHRLISNGLADGLYIALPTMATANSIYKRTSEVYRKLFDKDANPSLILAHGSRYLDDNFCNSILPINKGDDADYYKDEITAEAHCNKWLADNKKKSLLAHVGVGTIDQALLAILNSKHQSLRMLGLLGKVLIVDEVHANDSYMHPLLKTLLEFHSASGGSAILLSATLPQKMRQDLLTSFAEGIKKENPEIKNNDYPLLTHLDKSGLREEKFNSRQEVKRNIHFSLIHKSDDAEKLILKEVKANRCVCWIRNTVFDAIDAYKSLLKEMPEKDLMLFHARFAMGDRLAIEEEVTTLFGFNSNADDRGGKVVIATQVVEQSLDIDFDFMISDLAPIDLLIQRAGRLKRHKRDKFGNPITDGDDERGDPELVVLTPPPIEDADDKWFKSLFPKGAFVYPNHGELWLTAKLIAEKKMMNIPDDLRLFIETVYSEEAEDNAPKGLLDSSLKADVQDRVNRSAARLNTIDINGGYTIPTNSFWEEDSLAKTRLGEPTSILRLARWEDGKLQPWCKADKREWQFSEVSVRQYLAKEEKAPDDKEIKEKLALLKEGWGKIYSIVVVLIKQENGEWQGEAINGEGETVNVNYSKKYGLEIER